MAMRGSGVRVVGVSRRWGLGAALAAITATACGPSPEAVKGETKPASGTGSSATRASSNQRFKIGVSFEVQSVSPYDNGYWLTSYGAGQSLYRVTPEDKVVPWIAQSITPDGQEGYTIKLDPKAKFHNGKPIDARMVQVSLVRHLEAGSASVPSLKGAKWEIVDPVTLKVKTSQPDPWLPNYLSIAYMPIFDVDEVPEKEKLTPDVLNALVGKGFFSGPFKVTKLSPQEMTMDAVPDAWDGGPRLEGVDVKFIKDPQARLAALKTGEIDMMLYVPADAVPQVKQTSGLHFKATPGTGRVWIQLNNARPPFNEQAVRQALAVAINRKQIAENVLNGAYATPDSIYPSAMPWNVPGLLKTDLEAAKKLLDDAGWKAANDGIRAKEGKRLSFELLHYPQQPDAKPMAEALQAQLKAVGMEVKLKQVDDINAALRSKDYDAGIRFNGMQQAANPTNVLNTYFRTDSPRNEGTWGSPELDRLIQQLNVDFDANRRNELLKQVQEYFRREVPITFTVSRQWAVALNDRFADYVPTHDVDHY
ncbi:MAG TPA: ABC transporter substrate-binding protein, partial [Chloroflexota bacterium]|nr:ABC transporter substrate-binding protein [Chloroflexota bacterium]